MKKYIKPAMEQLPISATMPLMISDYGEVGGGRQGSLGRKDTDDDDANDGW